MDTHTVIEDLRGRREAIVATLGRLIAARTENPPGDEHRAAEVVAEFCRRLDITYDIREAAEGRSNIVARVGSRGGPRVAVVCHLDTVPAGEGWSSDPFEATVRDGRLYGRGAKDNKGSLAAAMAAVEYLKEHEDRLAGEVLLIGAADEERGSTYGAQYLVTCDDIRSLDAAIVPDAGSNLADIDIAEKGMVFVRITCRGRQAHGSTPTAGVNAIIPMADLVLWLHGWDMPGGRNELFHPSEATKNVGLIQGGSAPNMVPARCELQLDMRYLPGTDRDELLAAIRGQTDRLEKLYPGAEFDIEPMMGDVPTAVDEDAPVVAALADAVETVTGRRPKSFGMSGATVAKQFIAAGVPAVGICPGDPETEHVADEYIPIDELVDFAAVLAVCLLDLVGSER